MLLYMVLCFQSNFLTVHFKQIQTYSLNVQYRNVVKFTYPSNYLRQSLGFSIYTSMRSVIQFYLFPSESFYCFTVWIRVSMLMLNRRDESKFPWLVSHLRWKACSISPLSMIWAVVLSVDPLSFDSFLFFLMCRF